ncbi:MAG: hypothetical protein GEU78_13230 [Actinobacteria bacterium]|nr:hypothetical protein [Actinomycetota bacterium]
MASTQLVIPIEEIERGPEFPRVCVVTGSPAQTTIAVTRQWTPIWAYPLMYIGLGLFLGIHGLLGKRRTIHLPASTEVAERRRRLAKASRVSLYLSFASLLAAVTGWPGFFFLFLGLVLASVVLAVLSSRFGPRVKMRRNDLLLSRVHPNFVVNYRALHTRSV